MGNRRHTPWHLNHRGAISLRPLGLGRHVASTAAEKWARILGRYACTRCTVQTAPNAALPWSGNGRGAAGMGCHPPTALMSGSIRRRHPSTEAPGTALPLAFRPATATAAVVVLPLVVTMTALAVAAAGPTAVLALRALHLAPDGAVIPDTTVRRTAVGCLESCVELVRLARLETMVDADLVRLGVEVGQLATWMRSFAEYAKSEFNYIKFHQLNHLHMFIPRLGVLRNFTMEIFERMHKDAVKRHTPNTNHKDIVAQTQARQVRAEFLRATLPAALAIDSSDVELHPAHAGSAAASGEGAKMVGKVKSYAAATAGNASLYTHAAQFQQTLAWFLGNNGVPGEFAAARLAFYSGVRMARARLMDSGHHHPGRRAVAWPRTL